MHHARKDAAHQRRWNSKDAQLGLALQHTPRPIHHLTAEKKLFIGAIVCRQTSIGSNVSGSYSLENFLQRGKSSLRSLS